jgi:hypothetical protein
MLERDEFHSRSHQAVIRTVSQNVSLSVFSAFRCKKSLKIKQVMTVQWCKSQRGPFWKFCDSAASRQRVFEFQKARKGGVLKKQA